MPVTDDDDFDGPVTMAATQSTSSKAEQRKSNKPIMEKRRRARINHCLNELKTLILNAMKKDPARHSKLEKADILEMTVKHLQTVQRQQLTAAVSADPSVITKFRSGFDECAAEVSRYISRLEGVDHGVKQRLSAHLHRCVSSLQQMTPPGQPNSHDNNNNNSSSQRAVLIPSRLPSGEIALVLPNYNSFLTTTTKSAFTAIKPPTEPTQSRFQPFQVEIPNSHLKAHISLPEVFEKPELKPHPERIHVKPAPRRDEGQARLQPSVIQPKPNSSFHMRPISTSPDRIHVKPVEVILEDQPNRLQPQVHQKPNPNLALHPKPTSPLKYHRYPEPYRARAIEIENTRMREAAAEVMRSRGVEYSEDRRRSALYHDDRRRSPAFEGRSQFEPPTKRFAVPSVSVQGEPRSVIVNDNSSRRQSPVVEDNGAGQQDMWRPW